MGAHAANGGIVAMALVASESLPADMPAARLSGYVCLEVLQDYPARVLRRRPDLRTPAELAALAIDPLFRGEPLGAGPAVWFVLSPDAPEQHTPGQAPRGQLFQMITFENDIAGVFGATSDRMSLPGLTAAIAAGAIPQLAAVSIEPGAAPPPT